MMIIALKMAAASSSQTSVNFTRLHGATAQNTQPFSCSPPSELEISLSKNQ
jgi:hypothetical protein